MLSKLKTMLKCMYKNYDKNIIQDEKATYSDRLEDFQNIRRPAHGFITAKYPSSS